VFNEIEKRGHSPEETKVGYKLKIVIIEKNRMKKGAPTIRYPVTLR